jgi:hypothetical protein
MNTLVNIITSYMNLTIITFLQPRHYEKIMVSYVVIVCMGSLHKIFGIPNVVDVAGKIAYPIIIYCSGSVLSLYVIRKIKEIDLVEDLEKDRNFEKMKKIEKS